MTARHARRAANAVSRSQARGWRADLDAVKRLQRDALNAAALCELDRDFDLAERHRQLAKLHADRAAHILGTLRRFNAEHAR